MSLVPPTWQVKHLEVQKKLLETRLSILQSQEDYDGKIDQVVRHIEADLLRQVENLTRDGLKLKAELDKNQEEVENSRHKWVPGGGGAVGVESNQTFESNIMFVWCQGSTEAHSESLHQDIRTEVFPLRESSSGYKDRGVPTQRVFIRV